MSFVDGDAEFNCLAVLDTLYSPPKSIAHSIAERATAWNLLWSDIRHRSRTLQATLRNRILDAGLASQLPHDLRPADWHLHMATRVTTDSKRPADIVILCVLEEEFNATLVAFGINQKEQPDTDTIFGHRLFHTVLQTTYCGRLSIWIGLIGQARNVVCANFCRDIFEKI